MGSLSKTFPILAAIWVVCGLLMLLVSFTNYHKDYAKINSVQQK